MIPEPLLRLHEFVSQPWPWYVGGPMIALIMSILLFFGKEFGISANFRVMCAADGGDQWADFFQFDWSSQGWNLLVAVGAMFGGYLAAAYFTPADDHIAHVSAATVESLNQLGVPRFVSKLQGQPMQYELGQVPLVPEWYTWLSLFDWRGWLFFAGGGFLVGFGARWAGGCTSGHAISGLSALQLGSLYAVIGFFLGGLLMTYVLFPLIF